MAITIEFLGICLFDFCSDREDLRVLLPNGVNRKKQKHLDNVGGKALPHYAMFLEFEGDRRLSMQRFDGTRVSFPGVKGARPKRPASTAIADLSQFTQSLTLKSERELRNPDLVACQVLLRGGRLVPSAPGKFRDYAFDSTLKAGHAYKPKLAPIVAWRINKDEVEMVFETAGEVTDIRVLRAADDVRYAIGNIDEALPSAWPTPRGTCDQNNMIIDEDFKWHYRLFDPPGKSWEALLKGKALPVPRVKCPPRPRTGSALRAAGAPTCHCAMC